VPSSLGFFASCGCTGLDIAGSWLPRSAPSICYHEWHEHAPRLGQGSIFFEHLGDAPCRDEERHRRCTGRWVALVSLGFGPDGKRLRRKVTGNTRDTVQDRLKKLHEELDAGVRTTLNYTVRRAAED